MEFYENNKYKNWKQSFKQSIEWQNGLTVPSSNIVLMWEYRPNAEFINQRADYSIKTNNFGFRDKDFQKEKKKNEFRSAFIGDSFTLGLRIKQKDMFVSLLDGVVNKQEVGFTTEYFLKKSSNLLNSESKAIIQAMKDKYL